MIQTASRGGKRRRGPRVTRREKQLPSHQDDGVPAEDEWATMQRLGKFVVDIYELCSDSDSESEDDNSDSSSSDDSSIVNESGSKSKVRQVTFKKGDDAILHSVKDDQDDVWVGMISKIRKRHNEDEVWVQVMWYWSGTDLSSLLKTFNALDLSPYERAASDLSDFVSARSFLAVTYVHEFHEDDVDQIDIGPHDLFSRSTLQFRKRSLQPRPGTDTCFCNSTYVLYPSKHLESTSWQLYADDDKMHFCPRTTCRRWYHVRCLVDKHHIDAPNIQYPGDRGVRLLAGDPDSDFDCPLLEWFTQPNGDMDAYELNMNDLRDSSSSPPVSPTGDYDGPPMSASLATALNIMAKPSVLKDLPASLVQVAQYPIVRRSGPPKDGWSAVGNGREVALARRLIYAAFEGANSDSIGSIYDKLVTNGDAKEDVALLEELSDKLVQYSILASPYKPYWERRGGELQAETWMYAPAFICPSCKRAI